MIGRMMVCMTMMGACFADEPAPAAGDRAADLSTYQAAEKEAGRDAQAQVRLALWCESHGLSAERIKHLAMAVLYDPCNRLARGLMGLVAYQGKWERPDVVGRKIQDDPAYRDLIREYLERRAKTSRKPDAQARLAAWCEQKGLKEQATAHFLEAVRLDPSREATWRHLGYKKQGNRWVKPEALAAERREAEQQRHADKQWEPKLKRLREALDAKDPARRAKAEAEAAQITDPRAIPMIWSIFVRGNERLTLIAVQMLGQIDGPAASNALAALAVFNSSAQVRSRAIETLARRDPRDIIGRLIQLIRKPFKYQVRPVNGPGSLGILFVEGERFNIRRLYLDPPINPATMPSRIFSSDVPFDPYNLRTQILASTPAGGNLYAAAVRRDMQIAATYQAIQRETQRFQQSLAQDIQAVETTNTQINEVNGRALPVLKLITGQDLGAEPEQWKSWWTDQLGYVYQSSASETKPTYTSLMTVSRIAGGTGHSACFAAGTLVSTLDGPRAIESIQVGDRVLAQNTTTGALAFQPVVAVHRNGPSPTLRLDIGGETIVATGIHRFWKAGKGWTMARELKPGDVLRTVGGVARVQSIVDGDPQPVYNLDVSESRDFFVGTNGYLVHDFTFVQPVSAPFDSIEPLPGPDARPAATKSVIGR